MDNNNMMPAVVLSSHIVGLGVIRALGSKGVPITAVSYQRHDMGNASKYVTDTLQVPHPEKDENGFVNALVVYGEKHGRSVLIPADDATLTAVSRNKDLLSTLYIVACPDWSVSERIMNKAYTYDLAESLGVATPRTAVVSSREELEEVMVTFRFPCLIKPCLSHLYYEAFNKKLTKVHTTDEMLAAYLEAEEMDLSVMAQEYIPGNDDCGVHYNSYFCKGEPVSSLTAAKVRMSPPGAGIPRVVISKDVPEIVEPTRRMLKALDFTGFSCTEFKRDPRDGKYKLLEINGRHNRSGLLSVRCGVNFPWQEYSHLVSGEIQKFEPQQNGVYWIDEFHDIVQSIHYMFAERYRPNSYLQPYIHPHTFAVLDKSDFNPFVQRCVDVPIIAVERFLNKSRDLI